MPQDSHIHAIIGTILQYDAEPPNEDYSHVDFTATLARSMASAEVRELTRVAISRLPASLAVSVLEGVSSVAAKALDPQLLFGAIPTGLQVDSDATVVSFIVSKFAVAPDDVAAELLRRLDQTLDAKVQDRYAFGLWTLFCSETLLVPENKLVVFFVSPADEEIRRQLRRRDLSQYARETLKECLAASRPDDQTGRQSPHAP